MYPSRRFLHSSDCANASPSLVPKGSRWKYVQLLGDELDLRHVTWRLPVELIPRYSDSSCFSSDTEGLLHEGSTPSELVDSDATSGSLPRSGTSQPQAGEGWPPSSLPVTMMSHPTPGPWNIIYSCYPSTSYKDMLIA